MHPLGAIFEALAELGLLVRGKLIHLEHGLLKHSGKARVVRLNQAVAWPYLVLEHLCKAAVASLSSTQESKWRFHEYDCILTSIHEQVSYMTAYP